MKTLKYLTQQQLSFYQENGYLVIPDLVEKTMCSKLMQRADELVETLRPEWDRSIFTTREQARNSNEYFLSSGDQIRVFMEEEADQLATHRVNKLGHAMHDLDPVFRSFSHQALLADIASDVGFQQPGLLQSMYIFKQARIGGAVNIHQDATFLYTDPISVVGFWFALQEATLENGCLWALPGGHKLGLKSRFFRKGDGTAFETLDKHPLPDKGYVPLEVLAGTLVLLHGLLPHYSGANLSAKSREAYALHIIEQKASYPHDNWLQRGAEMPLESF